MRRSTDRFVTSHVGSLPRPRELISLLQAKQFHEAGFDAARLAEVGQRSINEVVKRQLDIGLDVIDDGEHTKISFSSYAQLRLSGLAPSEKPGFRGETRDSLAFPEVYKDLSLTFGARVKARGYPRPMANLACVGPLKFIGQKEVQADIDALVAAMGDHPRGDAFITSISPTNLELYHRNEYYKSEEEYLIANCDAMREEYKMIVDAGFIVQIDDPRLITHYNRAPDITMAENRKFI